MFLPSSFGVVLPKAKLPPVDESIFYPVVPTVTVHNELTPVGLNLGMTFITQVVGGNIHSLCYYRVSDTMSSSGTMALWQITNYTDVMLSTVDYTGHSGTGWRVVPLPEPIPVSPAHAYVVHLWLPSDGTTVPMAYTQYYFVELGRFSSPWAMLYATANVGTADTIRGYDRRNGLISTGTFARPATWYNSSQYWLDVIINASPVPAPPEQPMTLKWPMIPGYPSAETTGPDPETEFTVDLEPVTTNADDQVIEDRDMQAGLTIQHNNVTVRNCKIRNAFPYVIYMLDGTSGLTVEDCIMDGVGRSNPNSAGVAIGGTDVLIQRCNIYRVENGLAFFGHPVPSNIVFKDSFIHNLRASPGSPHYDGMQLDGGNSNIVIEHSTVFNENSHAAAIMIDNYGGGSDNILVTGNYLCGGGYTCYDDDHFYSDGSQPITNLRYINNILQPGQFGYFNINIQDPEANFPLLAGNQFLAHGGLFGTPPPGGFVDGQIVPESFFGMAATNPSASIVGGVVSPEVGGITFGLSFTPLVDGEIASVNFYRPNVSSNAMVKVGLWRYDGATTSAGTTLLASQTFSGVVKTGLVNFPLTTPVTVEVGENYLVGVFIPRGSDGKVWWAQTNGVFWPDPVPSQWERLMAFAHNPSVPYNGFAGKNGMYTHGPDLVPPLLAEDTDSNYYVDPVFVAPWVAEASPDVTVSVTSPSMSISSGGVVAEIDGAVDAIVEVTAPAMVAEQGGVVATTTSAVNVTVDLTSPAMAAEQGSVTADGSTTTSLTVEVTSPAMTLAQGDIVATTLRHVTTQVTSPPLTITRGTVTGTGKRRVTVSVTSPALTLVQGNEIVTTPSDFVVGDASNTGVPSGTVLTNSGSITTTAHGQIIQDKNCSGTIHINHNNVTVRRCRVTVGTDDFGIRMSYTISGVIIEDCELVGSHSYTGIMGGGIIRRCNIHGFENGVDVTLDVVKILNNWVWGMPSDPGSHDDTLQIDGGCTDLEIGYNTLENLDGACVMLDTYSGSHTNCDIHHNVMISSGGSYTAYCEARPPMTITNTRFRFNQMDSAQYGYFNIVACSPTLTGNTDRLTGDPISG